MDPSNIMETDILSTMAKNNTLMGCINLGLTLNKHIVCMPVVMSLEFLFRIVYQVLKDLHSIYTCQDNE